ncbi:MAG: bifunctional hydroxymethylpyrimidine kinase/phosphomethylpyrimidine kinase [Deltaproteobacteria bacterium]|nr:bifunctional hydroxymethylpyrimidine kinase/phosphomethylpyrimidine kinase [Deltaproteobacteria bacterium]
MSRNALIIAGFDPVAGAGLLMDIKVLTSAGIHASAIPTALVIENTDVVKDVVPIKTHTIKKLIDISLSNTKMHGMKIGMLYSKENINLVKDVINTYKLKNVVLDPVLVSSSGSKLLNYDALKSLYALIPLCSIITPNIHEAKIITKINIESKDDMIRAGKYFLNQGVPAVVIKGGHFILKATDLYMDKKQHIFLKANAINKDVHGTGCIFSSAITAYLIKGYDTMEAVKNAKLLTSRYIKGSYKLSYNFKRYVGRAL